mmetsp:Transcript_6588/g.20580  ORF Transcript_6588/g.20580 Transcript_6588/m.20580 type:complete len:136 (+) Transcript_6588:49-456(+)
MDERQEKVTRSHRETALNLKLFAYHKSLSGIMKIMNTPCQGSEQQHEVRLARVMDQPTSSTFVWRTLRKVPAKLGRLPSLARFLHHLINGSDRNLDLSLELRSPTREVFDLSSQSGFPRLAECCRFFQRHLGVEA